MARVAAKVFTGLPLDGPDPECVLGHGEVALAARPAGEAPRPGQDHSRMTPAMSCDENPLPVLPVRATAG